jgi:hypothetical protein
VLGHVGVQGHAIELVGHVQRLQQAMFLLDVQVLRQRGELQVQVEQRHAVLGACGHDVGQVDGDERRARAALGADHGVHQAFMHRAPVGHLAAHALQ